MHRPLRYALAAALLALAGWTTAQAADQNVELGNLKLTAPKTWEAKEPRTKGIVSHEFSVPAAEGDDTPGRVTIGPLGGGTKANLDRWVGSFRTADGKPVGDAAKIEKKEIGGQEVHVIDVTGTYSAPPFAGGGTFKDHRLLGAFIVGENAAYYVKFMGGKRTVAENEKAFNEMISGLSKK